MTEVVEYPLPVIVDRNDPDYDEFKLILTAFDAKRAALNGNLTVKGQVNTAKHGQASTSLPSLFTVSLEDAVRKLAFIVGDREVVSIIWYPTNVQNDALYFYPGKCSIAFLRSIAAQAKVEIVSARQQARDVLLKTAVSENNLQACAIAIGTPLAGILATLKSGILDRAKPLFTINKLLVQEYVPPEVLQEYNFCGHLVLEYHYNQHGVVKGAKLLFFIQQDEQNFVLTMVVPLNFGADGQDKILKLGGLDYNNDVQVEWVGALLQGVQEKVLKVTSDSTRVSIAPATKMVASEATHGWLTISASLVTALFSVYSKVVGVGYFSAEEYKLALYKGGRRTMYRVSLQMHQYPSSVGTIVGLKLNYQPEDGSEAECSLLLNLAGGSGGVGRILSGKPDGTFIDSILAGVLLQLNEAMSLDEAIPECKY